MKRTPEINAILDRWGDIIRRREAQRAQERRWQWGRELRERLAAEQVEGARGSADGSHALVAEAASVESMALTTPTRRMLADVLADIGGLERAVAEAVASRVRTEADADAIIAAPRAQMVELARRWVS